VEPLTSSTLFANEEEEKPRREEEQRRKQQEEERRRIQSMQEAENDGWTPWEGDAESDAAGAENPGRDDRNEADFEVKEEEEEETNGLDAMEPAVVDVPRNEPSPNLNRRSSTIRRNRPQQVSLGNFNSTSKGYFYTQAKLWLLLCCHVLSFFKFTANAH